MGKITWNDSGNRLFETGIDRGVLYTTDGSGVAWNGLTSVKENTVGGDSNPYYLDGVRYRNISKREELEGTIEAYTYPDEFSIHDGTLIYDNGLIVQQQARLPFALSYRTLIGNDLVGNSFAYKLHIIYNVLAEPSDKTYSTINSDTDPLTFSWNFSTTPQKPISVKNVAPLSHAIIDSRKTDPTVLSYIESVLYGTSVQEASLLSLNSLFRLFDYTILTFTINPDPVTGLTFLTASNNGIGDIIGNALDGLFNASASTRLVETTIDGLYTLQPIDPLPVPDPTPDPIQITPVVTTPPAIVYTFMEDPAYPGTFIGNAVAEDLTYSGTYIIVNPIVSEDPAYPGTYLYVSSSSTTNTSNYGLVEDSSDPGMYVGDAIVEDPDNAGEYLIQTPNVHQNSYDPGIFDY